MNPIIRTHSARRSCRMAIAMLVAVVAAASTAPALGMATVFAIKPDNKLLRFKSNTPAVIDATLNITGLQVGETLIGIDFRPETGGLYGIGTTARLYVIDPTTGVATQIGSGVFSSPLVGTSFGMDFNPIIDRIRVVSDADANGRINPANGTIAGVDSNLFYVAGDAFAGFDPRIEGIAYQEINIGGTPGTTLFGIDSLTNSLVRIGGVNGAPSPNNGQLTTIGLLGVDTGDFIGFDIGPNDLTLAAMDIAGVSRLFTINLATGAATLVGTIGDGTTISGIAIAPVGRFRFSNTLYSVGEAGAFATITVQRVGGSFGAVSVQYLVNDGTAVAPGDYVADLDTLTFGAGETSKTFNVVVNDDALVEPIETVNLTLLNPTGGATLGTPAAATLRILDNDGPAGGCGGGLCGLGMFPMVPLMLLGLRTMRRARRG